MEKWPSGIGDVSTEALCARILERHGERIKVQKPHLAAANLARIVRSVLKLSNRKGFHAMTLRELALDCGLSMGGLYSYFDSKDALLLMILDEVSATAKEVLSRAPSELAGDPRRHLEWLIETHIALTEAMHAWFAFVYMEAKSFPPAARKRAMASEIETEAIFACAIEAGVEAGDFAALDPGLTAALIKPVIQDWYVKRAKWRQRGMTADAYALHVQAFVRQALGHGEKR